MTLQTRKEREFRRREQDILNAALALFNRDDWQSVTVEQIAREAEIGKGTVYKHFDSKDEIYARLTLDFLQGLHDRVGRLDTGLPVFEYLRTVIREIWDYHMERRDYRRVVLYCRRDDFRRCVKPQTYQRFLDWDRNFDELIRPVLERGIAQGLLPRKPLPALTFGAAAACNGAILMAWTECPMGLEPEQVLEELTQFVLAGLVYQDRRF